MRDELADQQVILPTDPDQLQGAGQMSEENTKAPLALTDLKTGVAVSGVVTRLTMYGAMVDIGLEREALLHPSQLGHSNFRTIEDVLKVGENIDAFVLKADHDNGRVALTMVKPPSLPWEAIEYNTWYKGTVTRIEKFGAFVDIGAERPGMVHVSEMDDGYVASPSDVVAVGSEVNVRVIKMNRRKRQIDLSMKEDLAVPQEAMEPDEEMPTAMALALRRAMDGQEDDDEDFRPRRGRRDRERGSHRDREDIFNRTLRNHSDR